MTIWKGEGRRYGSGGVDGPGANSLDIPGSLSFRCSSIPCIHLLRVCFVERLRASGRPALSFAFVRSSGSRSWSRFMRPRHLFWFVEELLCLNYLCSRVPDSFLDELLRSLFTVIVWDYSKLISHGIGSTDSSTVGWFFDHLSSLYLFYSL